MSTSDTVPTEDTNVTVTEDMNPVVALADEPDSNIAKKSDMVIALIDTGVSEGNNVIDRVSLIDDKLEGNGHGDNMVAAIVGQNPDAKILSIRALDDNGKGTVSSIVAAMEYAINQNVGIINLSLYAKSSLLNSVLVSEIHKAIDAGIIVVGAAGNDGADVVNYVPGSVLDAYIIGACDENGNIRSSSNYGATVDYYANAANTSEAAAMFTGYISLTGTSVISETDWLHAPVDDSVLDDVPENTISYQVTSDINTDGGYVGVYINDKLLGNLYHSEELYDALSVDVNDTDVVQLGIEAYAGYLLTGYQIVNVDSNEVIVDCSDIADASSAVYTLSDLEPSDINVIVTFAEDPNYDALRDSMFAAGNLYLTSVLQIPVDTEFEPETEFEDIKGYAAETDVIRLVYSDLDTGTVGVYTTVYSVSRNDESFFVRRPVEVYSDTAIENSHYVSFISSSVDRINFNTVRMDYQAGDTVTFSVTPVGTDVALAEVEAFLADANGENDFILENHLDLTEVDTMPMSDELKHICGETDNTKYYQFTMPEQNVIVTACTENDVFQTAADGSDDELSKFVIWQAPMNTADTCCNYYNSNVCANYGRGTRYRTVTYTYLNNSGNKVTVTKPCYCLEPVKTAPFADGNNSYSSSAGEVVSLADSSVVSKALFYLYGGPMWNKTVTDSNDKDVNLKDVLDKYSPESGGPGLNPGHTGWRGYYALSHFVLSYCYAPSSESVWNYEDDGQGKGNPVFNATGKAWMKEIYDQIRLLPKPTVVLKRGRAEVMGTTISKDALTLRDDGLYQTPTLTYSTYEENTTKVTLPTGVSIHWRAPSNSDVLQSGTGTVSGIEGGSRFYLRFDLSKMTIPSSGKYDLTLNCKYAVNFEAWTVKTDSSFQNVGFGYYTGDKTLKVSFELPDLSHIEVKKVGPDNAWNNNLKGTVFTLYEGSSAKATVTINGSGYYRFNYDCQVGHTYTIKETKTCSGYVTASDITCAITAATYKAVYQYTVSNGKSPEVYVTKSTTCPSDILALSSYSKQGAEFGVYSDSACTKMIAKLTSGSNGQTGKATLPCQASGTYTYYVKETKAPAGHKINNTAKSFTVNLPADAGKTKSVTITDEPEYCEHDFDVKKLGGKGEAVEGVIFKVQYFDAKSADAGKLMKTWYLKSDDRGEVYLDDWHLVTGRTEYKSDSFFKDKDVNGNIVIPIGGYLQMVEVEAPAEYIVDSTPVGFLTTTTVEMKKTMYNDPEPCTIQLKKLDSKSKSLPNVEFEIEFIKESETPNANANPNFKRLLKLGEKTTGKTDSNGELIFSNLDHGTYRITETKTIGGNTLLKDPIEVTVPMEMTQAEADAYGNVDYSNAKKDTNYTGKWFFYNCLYEITNTAAFKVPMTGSSGTWKYGFVGIGMVAVVGTGLFVHNSLEKKRKKKSKKTKA